MSLYLKQKWKVSAVSGKIYVKASFNVDEESKPEFLSGLHSGKLRCSLIKTMSKSHTSLHWKWEGACLWILSCRSFGAGLGEPWKMQSESLWARGRALRGHTVCYLETCLFSPGAKYTQVFLHFLLLTWHLRCAVWWGMWFSPYCTFHSCVN